MNSLRESEIKIYVDNKMLNKLKSLLKTLNSKEACFLLLKDYLNELNLEKIEDNFFLEQATSYYISGPAWRQDDFLFERSILKGFEAGCSQAGRLIRVKFEIDDHCFSKIKNLLKDIDKEQ